MCLSENLSILSSLCRIPVFPSVTTYLVVGPFVLHFKKWMKKISKKLYQKKKNPKKREIFQLPYSSLEKGLTAVVTALLLSFLHSGAHSVATNNTLQNYCFLSEHQYDLLKRSRLLQNLNLKFFLFLIDLWQWQQIYNMKWHIYYIWHIPVIPISVSVGFFKINAMISRCYDSQKIIELCGLIIRHLGGISSRTMKTTTCFKL